MGACWLYMIDSTECPSVVLNPEKVEHNLIITDSKYSAINVLILNSEPDFGLFSRVWLVSYLSGWLIAAKCIVISP